MSNSFVHLHLHSEYSLVDSCVRIPALIDTVAGSGMPAVAVTDQSNMFAMVKFYRSALRRGIKPIVGVDLWVLNDLEHNRPGRLILLCQNRQGYLNLTRLVSRSYIEGQQRGTPVVNRDWFEGASEGLIALSGGHEGDIGQALMADNKDQAQALLQHWQALFPDRFYIELQRTGHEQEDIYLPLALQLATEADVPVVATNNVRFLVSDDFGAHESRVCIHDGRTLEDPRRSRLYTEQQYLRTPEEMTRLFADIPEALTNTVEIAKRCNLQLSLGKNVLPDFPVPKGQTIESYFREQAREGLKARLRATFNGVSSQEQEQIGHYETRLAHELDVIVNMGYPGYFLIVADFIRWAKENDIPVGPGRGSGAGSLVAYTLGITDLDPIRYDLLFERFLNPERVSLPDFDIDFCMEGRDRVIEYVTRRYGRERVSQIITYGTMAAKAVVRDVGRVLGHPYGFVDQLAKLIPFELGITLDKALADEDLLKQRYDEEEDVRTLIDLARSLEGLVRNAGRHAGGVVIAPSDLTDFTPLYCEQGSSGTVTQFDKDDVEAIGLVKFDFLGLRTLTIIDHTIKAVNRTRTATGEAPLDINEIPLDDKESYDLLKRCATTAVFQLESRGMKELIKRLQPDCFDEIIALVALFRPGPLQSGMVDDFINRKHGARVDYLHPALEPILKPTYGVILYQEQVMQIAQVLAGYSLGQADLLRRAMGKKKPEEMAKQRTVFLDGAREKGIKAHTAEHIFNLMDKFAGYGFNKSHSAAYALIAYQTAWLKAHYPAAFMAAVLSSDMDNTDKVMMLIDECRTMGLAISPPNINTCEYEFTVGNEATILYGLGAIKGVGSAALEGILAQRNEHGPFEDLLDLCSRIDLRRANRRVLEALIKSGALDVVDSNRARSMTSLTTVLQMAERHIRNLAAGQDDMFGSSGAPSLNRIQMEDTLTEPVSEWSEQQRLQAEKETLGLYLTGHPIERYTRELSQFVTTRIADLKPSQDQSVIVAGLVVALRTLHSRRGDKIAFVSLDDRSGRLELAVFAEAYQRNRELLVKDRLLVVEGTVSIDEYSGGFRMSAENIYDIDRAREVFAKGLEIDVEQLRSANGFIGSLAEVLHPFREGNCPVWINYQGQHAAARMALGQEWRIHPTDELLHRLTEVAGPDNFRMVY